jgi:predicted nucleic acid-binding protein
VTIDETRELGATLVTKNTRHFRRFEPALVIENWVTDPPE